VPKSPFQRARANAAPLVVTATAFTAVSTAAIQINSTGVGRQVIVLLPTQNCFIKFGDASVGAATSADWPLVANQRVRFVVSNDSSYFRVVRNSADGVLDWYVASKAV